MKTYRNRIIFITLVTLLGIGYFFWIPISQFIGISESNEKIENITPLKLGLDLQGGMRVVLEVDIVKMFENIAQNKDVKFQRIIDKVRKDVKENDVNPISSLQNELKNENTNFAFYFSNTPQESDNEIIARLTKESENAIERGLEIIRNRVDQFGVSEPTIQKQGNNRIIVELAGIKDQRQVRTLLQGTALLEFKILKEIESIAKVYEGINGILMTRYGVDTTIKVDTTKKDTTSSTTKKEKSEEEIKRESPFYVLVQPPQQNGNEGFVLEQDKDSVNKVLALPEVQKILSDNDMQFHWSAKPIGTNDKGKRFFSLYSTKLEPELTGGVVENAKVDFVLNQPVVNMQMNSEGARDWARITGANLNKRIAILLDNSVYSAPTVRSKISGGGSQIEGMDIKEANVLEIVLKAGALPAPVEIIEQQSVGASLGADSIQKGVFASILALVLTVLFMIVYYNFSGVIANFALIINILFTLILLSTFDGTLTLPGIAGIILSMAVAVDANVLINERIHEEMTTGKTLRASIDAGYKKAFTAIFDSNVTTFITAVVLFQFGSGSIQGFALTLMIGIVVSMITAIWVTHIIFNSILSTGRTVSFG